MNPIEKNELKKYSQRLASFINEIGSNQHDFSIQIGTSVQNVANAMRGANSQITFISKIKAKYPNLNLNWLIAGEDPEYITGLSQAKEHGATYQVRTMISDECRHQLEITTGKLEAARNEIKLRDKMIELLETTVKRQDSRIEELLKMSQK